METFRLTAPLWGPCVGAGSLKGALLPERGEGLGPSGDLPVSCGECLLPTPLGAEGGFPSFYFLSFPYVKLQGSVRSGWLHRGPRNRDNFFLTKPNFKTDCSVAKFYSECQN